MVVDVTVSSTLFLAMSFSDSSMTLFAYSSLFSDIKLVLLGSRRWMWLYFYAHTSDFYGINIHFPSTQPSIEGWVITCKVEPSGVQIFAYQPEFHEPTSIW